MPQVTMFDAPMTERQLDYLRKVHKPVIARHNISQAHYDLMVGHLVDAMRTNGAQVRAEGMWLVWLQQHAWSAIVCERGSAAGASVAVPTVN
jgi:hypothetical protein